MIKVLIIIYQNIIDSILIYNEKSKSYISGVVGKWRWKVGEVGLETIITE